MLALRGRVPEMFFAVRNPGHGGQNESTWPACMPAFFLSLPCVSLAERNDSSFLSASLVFAETIPVSECASTRTPLL